MAQELRLRTNTTPSIFNKDMLLGGLIGASIPVFGVGTGAAVLIWAGLAAAGATIGGIMGKNRIETENREGKPVGEPSFWNKDTAIGGLIGWQLAAFTALAAGAATAVAGLGLTAATGSPAVAGGTIAFTVLAALGGLVAGPVIGGWIGGKMGEKRMAREYQEAKHQQIVEHVSRNVSPEIGEAVGYTMEHNKDWGKTELENRLLAAAQENAR